MRLRLGACLFAALAAMMTACIPWPRRTYQVAPAFAGELRLRDGGPVGGALLLVSSAKDCSRPIAHTVTDSAGRFQLARSQRSTHWLLLVPVEFPRTAYALCAGPPDSLRVVDSGWLPLSSKLTALPVESLSCLQYVWEGHTVVACRDTAKMRQSSWPPARGTRLMFDAGTARFVSGERGWVGRPACEPCRRRR